MSTILTPFDGRRLVGSEQAATVARLKELCSAHRELDLAVASLLESGTVDQLQLARLKKRKLRLRDEIVMLEDQLIPDIIA